MRITMDYFSFIIASLTILFFPMLCQVCWIVFWRPYILTKFFSKQRIAGPPYKVLSGSLDDMKKMKRAARERVLDTYSHDITPRVLPHYHKWASKYGETFLYWYGTKPRVYITDPELAKQILSNKMGFYVKPQFRSSQVKMVGKGLVVVEGLDWVRHRRILNPAFTMDKLKAMVKQMAACTLSMVERWENEIITAAKDEGKEKEIEINGEFQRLTADIIAHSAFGSSYVHGKEAFEALRELQKLCAATITDIFIPGTQYLPTPSNIRIWRLDRKLKKSLRSIIESRVKSSTDCASYQGGDDLLSIMISASTSDGGCPNKLEMDEIMDECKTFFFAGHETTSNLLTWTLFLLSIYPEWQDRLRQEVLSECGMSGIPDADILSKLKLVNMVLLETLRLYCPVIELWREALEDMKLGDVIIPKGTSVAIPLVKIHRSKEYWGEDANEFNPWRFKNGVAKAAKHPNALLAFSVGPRACIGQNFAMLEAKTVLALLLQRLSFTLSPAYKHAPVDYLTLHPQFGLPLFVSPLGE